MKALATTAQQAVSRFSPDQIDLIKRTICKGASDDELRLFMYQAERTGLDPLARQIYAVKRWDAAAGREVMSIQTSIDGFRLIAERSGKYAGQQGPYWCGADGEWVDVWTKPTAPVAARVGILRSDFKEPLWGVAKYESYAQKKKDGTPTRMWLTMADVMIAKCAEGLGLRKAFPQELSGLYTNDEMDQAQQEAAPAKPNVMTAPATTAEHIPHDTQTGEITDWITFGQDMIAAAKSAPNGSEQVLKVHAVNIALMEKGAPKVYKRMMAAIEKAKQPLPTDDPEAYLKWLTAQCAAINEPSTLHGFAKSQDDAIKSAFPPDAEQARHIIATREKALENA